MANQFLGKIDTSVDSSKKCVNNTIIKLTHLK